MRLRLTRTLPSDPDPDPDPDLSRDPLPRPSPPEQARFHLHFGAGRLGMGLVVPAISASGIPFGVVQRPKPRWVELFTQDGTSDVGLRCVSSHAYTVHIPCIYHASTMHVPCTVRE